MIFAHFIEREETKRRQGSKDMGTGRQQVCYDDMKGQSSEDHDARQADWARVPST